MPTNPYKDLPVTAFWRKAVASVHYEDISDLWSAPALTGEEKFATAGSCFAQHIGRHILRRGASNYLDLEPPPIYLPETERENFGYGIYSCRYGNIYTSRQLLQLAMEASGERPVSNHVWEKNGRYFDALRPSVDPVGLDNLETITDLRRIHLSRVREMLEGLDVFVFTLGLTETWVDPDDGTAFPTAPGVIAGSPEINSASYINLTVDEVRNDLIDFWRLLLSINPTAKMILTVSPVPLIATASGKHVLSATTYSKSVLRVAAEEMASNFDEIYYFPSYEIINSVPGRGFYFEPDLRGVNRRGVDYVMSHFFSGDLGRAFPEPRGIGPEFEEVVCDEEWIEK